MIGAFTVGLITAAVLVIIICALLIEVDR